MIHIEPMTTATRKTALQFEVLVERNGYWMVARFKTMTASEMQSYLDDVIGEQAYALADGGNVAVFQTKKRKVA